MASRGARRDICDGDVRDDAEGRPIFSTGAKADGTHDEGHAHYMTMHDARHAAITPRRQVLACCGTPLHYRTFQTEYRRQLALTPG